MKKLFIIFAIMAFAVSVQAAGPISFGGGGDMPKSTYDTNSDSMVDADKINAGIDAAKIGGGGVSTTEFDYLGSVTSNVQTQITSKQADMGITAKSDSTSTTSSTSVASSTAVKAAYDLAALKLNTADPAYTGKLTGAAPTELTIATDAITVTQTFHTVDTQADAASDDLATISGFSDTQIIFLRASHTDRSVVLVETGNILIPYGTQITLDDTSRWVMLVYDANLTKWVVIGTLPDTLSIGAISLGGVILGTAVPDAAGKVGYSGGNLQFYNTALRTVKTTSEVEKIASFAWDGGGSAVATASSKRCTVIPFAATITGVYAIADASTTSHLHVYQDAFAAGARSTTVTGAVDIGATLGSLDTTLTSWDTSITAGDEICMSVESNNNAKWLSITVYGHR